MWRSTSISGHINLLPPGSVRLFKVGAVGLIMDCPVRMRSQPLRLFCSAKEPSGGWCRVLCLLSCRLLLFVSVDKLVFRPWSRLSHVKPHRAPRELYPWKLISPTGLKFWEKVMTSLKDENDPLDWVS